MIKSTITVEVDLDENRVAKNISWKASDSTAEQVNKSKAMMLSFWDGAEKTALRIDLWTKEMLVDEMADFYYQTFMTMADTFNRATGDNQLTADMKKFAKDFYTRFREGQLKTNKLS